MHPYHLRQFRNRWFLLCMTDGKNYISNYPLDRIESISPVSIPYLKTNIDFDEWFDDVVGVTVRNTPLVEVLIKVNNDRYGYIKTKPLHPSQTERWKQAEDGYTYITIKVKVNSELISLLASFGADIEVVSPYSESTEKVLFFKGQNEKCLRFITFLSTNRLNKAMIGRKRRVKRLFLRY